MFSLISLSNEYHKSSAVLGPASMQFQFSFSQNAHQPILAKLIGLINVQPGLIRAISFSLKNLAGSSKGQSRTHQWLLSLSWLAG